MYVTYIYVIQAGLTTTWESVFNLIKVFFGLPFFFVNAVSMRDLNSPNQGLNPVPTPAAEV